MGDNPNTIDYSKYSGVELQNMLIDCDNERTKIKGKSLSIKRELDKRKVYKKLEAIYNDLPEDAKESFQTVVLKPRGIESGEKFGDL